MRASVATASVHSRNVGVRKHQAPRFDVPTSTQPDLSSDIARAASSLSQSGMKAGTVQVNVKMSEDDFALLLGAANLRWPEAIISNSGVLDRKSVV